jgi:membrane-bound lytic murein transglycosylase B
VRFLASFQHARATVGTVVGAASLAAVMALLPSAVPSAHASTGDPGAQVQQILAKVDRLQTQAKAAETRYSRAFTSVTQSVSHAISADQDSSAIEIEAANAQSELLDRVRGLYESGGTLAAYAAWLDSGSVTSVMDQSELASRVVSAQVADTRDVQREAAAAQRAANRAEHVEHVRIHTVSGVTRAASRVETLLAQQKTLLARADKSLAAVQQAESALTTQTAHFATITTNAVSDVHILPPSQEYLSLYQAAASHCPGLSWTILAAIGQVESGHGRNDGPSYAGAEGPMQFEPSTFEVYGVDGDGDGVKSIMDPADAIYSAANYLCANGAGGGGNALFNAIWHYNHADWYVELVENLASLYASAYA